jgi:hypothetical protein
MRILVTGGRKYADRARVYSALDAVHAKHTITLLIEGGAKGADRLARDWATLRGVPFVTEKALWDQYGNAAGVLRNAAMLVKQRPDAVVAFPGGRGTADMVARARAAGLPVWELPPVIFVFGSNLAGRHGKGAAKDAVAHHGAVYGQGSGLQGNSYAIPTKDYQLRPLPLADIALHVEKFKRFAALNPRLRFMLTPIGCGRAGYTPAEIAPMFAGSPPNVDLPPEFCN